MPLVRLPDRSHAFTPSLSPISVNCRLNKMTQGILLLVLFALVAFAATAEDAAAGVRGFLPQVEAVSSSKITIRSFALRFEVLTLMLCFLFLLPSKLKAAVSQQVSNAVGGVGFVMWAALIMGTTELYAMLLGGAVYAAVKPHFEDGINVSCRSGERSSGIAATSPAKMIRRWNRKCCNN